MEGDRKIWEEAAQAVGLRALGVCSVARVTGGVGVRRAERRDEGLEESESSRELKLSFGVRPLGDQTLLCHLHLWAE